MNSGTVDYGNAYIQKYLANLAGPAAETDALFKTMGYGSASDFLINLMGQESHYGANYNPDAIHTMTYAQIDPVRYWELLNDMKQYPGWAERGKTINDYMQSQPGYEDWDIFNMAQVDVQPKTVIPYAPGYNPNLAGAYGLYPIDSSGQTIYPSHLINEQNFDFNYVPGSISPHTADPRTAMMLSRLMLTKDMGDLPVTEDEQALKWDSFWNRNPAPGTGTAEFKNKLPYREVNDLLNNYHKTKLSTL